jgi:hypothetical protein
MNVKSYCLISGLIFGIVAAAHLCRLFAGWKIVLGGSDIPMWVSVPGLIVPALLCFWAFKFNSQMK